MLREVKLSDGRTLALDAPKPPPTLPELIDRRLALLARWDRLKAARLAEPYDDDEDEGGGETYYHRLGAVLARVQGKVWWLDARIAGLMDGAFARSCWHRGWLVECLSAAQPARPRIRLTRCPTAGEVRPVYCPVQRHRDAFEACEAIVTAAGRVS